MRLGRVARRLTGAFRVRVARDALGFLRVNLPAFVRYTFTRVRRFRFTGAEALTRLRRYDRFTRFRGLAILVMRVANAI